METEKLLKRLEQIGQSLSKRKSAFALIALGSVGENLERLEQHFDVNPKMKREILKLYDSEKA